VTCPTDDLSNPLSAAPQPTPTIIAATPLARELSDALAIEAIHRILNAPGEWSPDTLNQVNEIIAATGRRVLDPSDIESIDAEVLTDKRGWPVAHVVTEQVTAYVSQDGDGGMCVELYTRDAQARAAMRILIDNRLAFGPPLPASRARHSLTQQPAAPSQAA
jgi:hypothetical protein